METKKNLFISGSSEEIESSEVDLNQVVSETLAENELIQSARQNAFLREGFNVVSSKLSEAERIARSSQEESFTLKSQLEGVSTERDSLATENSQLKAALAKMALDGQTIQLSPKDFSNPDVLRSLGYSDPLKAIMQGKLTSQAPQKEASAFKGAPHVMFRSQLNDGLLRHSLKISDDAVLQQRIAEGSIIIID